MDRSLEQSRPLILAIASSAAIIRALFDWAELVIGQSSLVIGEYYVTN